MPHMAPMMWISISLFSLFLWILMMIMIYFFFFPKLKFNHPYMMKKNNFKKNKF